MYTFFKDYVLTNLQALYRFSKVKYETFSGKPTFLLTFLTFYTLRGSLDTKVRQKVTFPIYEERLVAAEHAMFKFDDLKVNSHYDRHTDRQNEKHKVRTLAIYGVIKEQHSVHSIFATCCM